MADKRIRELTPATSIKDEDLLVIEQDGAAKKLSGKTLSDYIGGSGGGGSALAASPMISITYAELKALRDNGTLIPGMQYRITDYSIAINTEVNEDEDYKVSDTMRVVSHPYDIIVVADDENTLNTNARACLHEGDNYYSAEGNYCDLSKWELKYSIDIDKAKYPWLDTTNSKGVVYWLKDDYGNDCAYDFKQIQFIRYRITEATISGAVNTYGIEFSGDNVSVTVDVNQSEWFYTFSDVAINSDEQSFTITDVRDASLGRSFNGDVHANASRCRVGEIDIWNSYNGVVLLDINNGGFSLGFEDYRIGDSCYNITFFRGGSSVFVGDYCNNIFCAGTLEDYFDYGVSYVIIGSQSNHIKILDESNDIAIGDSSAFCKICNSYSVTFGDYCEQNLIKNSNHITFGNSCKDNNISGSATVTFGNSCKNNTVIGSNSITFDVQCEKNYVDTSSSYITFGPTCVSNRVGTNATNVSFGQFSNNNVIGNACSGISINNSCSRNIIEQLSSNITLGNSCTNNAIKQNCSRITFDQQCNNNIVGSGCNAITLTKKYDCNIFNGCSNIGCTNAATALSRNNEFSNCSFVSFGTSSVALSNYRLFNVRGSNDSTRYAVTASASTTDPTYVIGTGTMNAKTIKLADIAVTT